MDRNSRVTFWQPQIAGEDPRSLGDILLAASGALDSTSYTPCSGGVRVRIERVTEHEEHLQGDFVRQQTEGLPPFAPEGQPLQSHNNPLGHRVAWAYYS